MQTIRHTNYDQLDILVTRDLFQRLDDLDILPTSILGRGFSVRLARLCVGRKICGSLEDRVEGEERGVRGNDGVVEGREGEACAENCGADGLGGHFEGISWYEYEDSWLWFSQKVS